MKAVLPILFFAMLCYQVDAQQKPLQRKMKSPSFGSWGSINLLMGVPMQEYKSSTGSLPFGLNLNYVYQPSVKVPLAIGINFQYLNVGSKTVDRDLTADITANGVLLDQLHIPLEFQINNNIVGAHADGRFIAPTNVVKPYVDALIGFNYLWTATSVYDRSDNRYFDTDDDGLIAHKTQIDDFTFSAGTGAGLLIQVGRRTFINAGAHYLFGGNAQYYDRSQIAGWDIQLDVSGVSQGGQGSFEPGDITYHAVPKKSRTDMLMIQAGLTFDFAR